MQEQILMLVSDNEQICLRKELFMAYGLSWNTWANYGSVSIGNLNQKRSSVLTNLLFIHLPLYLSKHFGSEF